MGMLISVEIYLLEITNRNPEWSISGGVKEKPNKLIIKDTPWY